MNNEPLTLSQGCIDRFRPVVEAINDLLNRQAGQVLVAIDGMSASGKTTLGQYLESLYDCNLFHMDDYFLRPEQRTPERLEEVGGNVDYERFKEEVLDPLKQHKSVTYQPYDCSTASLTQAILKPYKVLNFVEGSYSMHPYFGQVYDLRVFTRVNQKTQIQRIRKRNGEKLLKRFIDEWIPKENAYHQAFDLLNKCDLTVSSQ